MINKQLNKKYLPFFLSTGDYNYMLSAFSFEFNTQSSQLKKVYIQKGLYLLPFPLAYETTVSESKLHSRWGGVGKGKNSEL